MGTSLAARRPPSRPRRNEPVTLMTNVPQRESARNGGVNPACGQDSAHWRREIRRRRQGRRATSAESIAEPRRLCNCGPRAARCVIMPLTHLPRLCPRWRRPCSFRRVLPLCLTLGASLVAAPQQQRPSSARRSIWSKLTRSRPTPPTERSQTCVGTSSRSSKTADPGQSCRSPRQPAHPAAASARRPRRGHERAGAGRAARLPDPRRRPHGA